MNVHVCLGTSDPNAPDFCPECFCMYCGAALLPGIEGRCSDSNCENHWRRPTSLSRFGTRNH